MFSAGAVERRPGRSQNSRLVRNASEGTLFVSTGGKWVMVRGERDGTYLAPRLCLTYVVQLIRLYGGEGEGGGGYKKPNPNGSNLVLHLLIRHFAVLY